jgi:formylglycine-generating enzyme
MGGAPSTGGTPSLTGGASGAGGTTTVGTNLATGCTGNFEMPLGYNGLCVAKMVPITGPSNATGNTDYKIDATEVTKGQYDAWLATNPALPPRSDANCGYVTSYAEQGQGFSGVDADHHPVAFVDWCDAFQYCAGINKRLCGAIGGGPYAGSSPDANQGQWYRVCSSGGKHSYPYGNVYEPKFCNGSDYWNNSSSAQTVPVGSMLNCATFEPGYAGVYDLSGNVGEWLDTCDGPGKAGWCCSSGGAFVNGNGSLACGCTYLIVRYQATSVSGFRCCTP